MEKNRLFSSSDVYEKLFALLQEKILFFDGAMGTSIQTRNLNAEHFGHESYLGCNEALNIFSPALIQDIHRAYLSAGADIIETNTFGATAMVLGEYHLADRVYEINYQAAQLATQVASEFSSPRFVAGSLGPTNYAFSVTGAISFADLAKAYQVQAQGLLAGGVDILLLETIHDAVNMKAGLAGIRAAILETNISRPVMLSLSVDNNGRLLSGHALEAVVCSISHLDLLAIGLNCSFGPEQLLLHFRRLNRISPFFSLCMPNAGLPDAQGHYVSTPQLFCRQISAQGGFNLLGGCCGTTTEHIALLKETFSSLPPRQRIDLRQENPLGKVTVSGLDVVVAEPEELLLVGERMNVIGSRRFKNFICADKFDEALNLSTSQVRSGAQILDICLSNPDRNELADWKQILPDLCRRVRVPIMIDTVNDEVFAHVLPVLPGKCILNSVNLEHGEKRLARVAELLHSYGGLVVVGLIDESREMAVTCQKKLSIARRCHELLTQKYGLSSSDIIFDPLVFPCATGDEKYLSAARETISALRQIRREFPDSKTILGISNVSFGLPPAGREALNSVFLYYCTTAGLDFAILNPAAVRRYNTLSSSERELCEALIFNNSRLALDNFVNFYRQQDRVKKVVRVSEPLQRLIEHILQGEAEGLAESMRLALATYDALAVLNKGLLPAMRQVGQLFNSGQLIVAEVLESAGIMKKASDILTPFLGTSTALSYKKILLATVKGDVHDIGKNLVRSILSNNGYEVIDLGVRVDAATIIEAVRESKPDLIGLSALLVKSALEIADTARELHQADICLPLLVGGAALSETFCANNIRPVYKGEVFYASDAMVGLNIANKITAVLPKPVAVEYNSKYVEYNSKQVVKVPATPAQLSTTVQRNFSENLLDTRRIVVTFPNLAVFLQNLSDISFFRRYLGFTGVLSTAENSAKMHELKRKLAQVKELAVAKKCFRPMGAFAFFSAFSRENKIYICSDRKEETFFSFPVLSKPKEFCLAHFVGDEHRRPADEIALFVATGGNAHLDLVQELEGEGDYFSAHALKALSLECAEKAACEVHQVIRRLWHIDEQSGNRFSFGYPACPDLSGQELLFSLLGAVDLGFSLTENYMMLPENSVSGIVFPVV